MTWILLWLQYCRSQQSFAQNSVIAMYKFRLLAAAYQLNCSLRLDRQTTGLNWLPRIGCGRIDGHDGRNQNCSPLLLSLL